MFQRNKYRRTFSFYQPMRQHLWAMANQHAGFCKHFICEETLSCSDSPTHDQDISRIKYTRSANLTKLCRHHRETSTTIVSWAHFNIGTVSKCPSVITTNDTCSNLQLYPSLKYQIICNYLNFIHFKSHVIYKDNIWNNYFINFGLQG